MSLMLARARPGTPDAIVRDLSSSDVRVRIAAAEHAPLLAEGLDAEVRARLVGALTAALRDDHEAVRGAAALSLADLDAHEALPALLIAADDDAAIVRQFAITALGELGDPRATERIRRALRDPRPEVRYQAVVAFPRIAKAIDDVWSALGAGLDDDDAQVRGRAAEACAEQADGAELPRVVADRLARVAKDEEESIDTRVACAIALGESADERAAPVLLAVMSGEMEERDPRRVQAVFELAGELGLEAARPLATAAAFGLRARFGDPTRRDAALVALARLRDPRAIEHVLAELDARSFERRTVAVGIVSRAALPEARPRLEAMLRDPGADADGIADAIARIDAANARA